MANIPEPGLPDVAPRPLPVPEQGLGGASPDTFGAGEARTAQRVGGFADELFRQAKQRADATAVVGALGQAKAALNQIVLDPERGYASLHGADAMAGRDKALSEFDKSLNDISGSLTDDQRSHFEHQALFIKEQAFSHIIQHETHEQNQYAVAQYRGAVDQTMVTMENPAVVADPKSLKEQIDSLWQTGIDEAHRRFGQNASKDAIASVVIPELQRAAYGTMQAAIGMSETTGNPDFAKQALDQVGRYLVTGHHRDFAKVVEALSAKADIASGTSQVMAGAVESVMMPDGPPIPRVDATKVATHTAALPPETPHLAEILKAVDAQERVRNDLWSKSAAKVYERVHSAGQDPVTGDFDLQSPQINAADKAWLRQHAPGELDKLRAIDKRSTTGPAAREASLEALSQISSDMHDPQTWASTYSKMTSGQFLTLITSPQFADLAGPERLRAQRLFDANKAAENKLEEPIGTTVKKQIAEAFPEDPYERKAFESRYFEALRAAAQNFQNAEKAAGRKVDSEAISKFIDTQMAKQPSGHWYQPDKRLIEINAAAALQPPPVAAATQVAPPAAYRYSQDRKLRFPVDAQGNRLGPNETVP